MLRRTLIALFFCPPGHAETIGNPNGHQEGRPAKSIPASAPAAFQDRDFSLPVTKATGQFDGFLGGKCMISFERESENGPILIKIAIYNRDPKGGKSLSWDRGALIPAGKYPLMPGFSEDKKISIHLSSRLSYDGSTLRLTDFSKAGKEANVRLYELNTDSNLKSASQFVLRSYDGEKLDNAKQDGELICQAPIS